MATTADASEKSSFPSFPSQSKLADDSPAILFVDPSRVYQLARISSSQRLHDVSSSGRPYKRYVCCCLSRVLRITQLTINHLFLVLYVTVLLGHPPSKRQNHLCAQSIPASLSSLAQPTPHRRPLDWRCAFIQPATTPSNTLTEPLYGVAVETSRECVGIS